MRISDWSSDVCSSDLLESGGRMTAQIDWKAPAEYIADGAGTGAFIDKIEAGEARLIAATEADIAAAARLNDMKFLDTSHRSEEHTSELQSLMRISYAVFCLKKKRNN